MRGAQRANANLGRGASPERARGSSSGDRDRERDISSVSGEYGEACELGSHLPGWERQTAPDGTPFYVDHNTQQTHWELPAAARASAEAAAAAAAVRLLL